MIDGVQNFRDLGGLRTQDGRVVKPGCLFRGGALDAVSDAGVAQMAQLGLRAYFDLRSSPERRTRPARLPQHGGPRLVFHAHDRLTGALYHELERSASEGELAQKCMLALYRELPYSHRDAYRMLFQELLDGAWPLAFGCAAGKDRTGVAALCCSVHLASRQQPSTSTILRAACISRPWQGCSSQVSERQCPSTRVCTSCQFCGPTWHICMRHAPGWKSAAPELNAIWPTNLGSAHASCLRSGGGF